MQSTFWSSLLKVFVSLGKTDPKMKVSTEYDFDQNCFTYAFLAVYSYLRYLADVSLERFGIDTRVRHISHII